MDTPEPLRMKLAIVFCDIAGFTELTATEGDLAVVKILNAFFGEVDRLTKEYRPLTIKYIGDAFLASFENFREVIPFICSVQDLLTQGGALSGRGLAFKFSFHFGDAIYTQTSYGPDIFGESVNIAAQLNGSAERDQLVVSEAALDTLPGDLKARAGATETLTRRRQRAPVEFRRIQMPLPLALT